MIKRLLRQRDEKLVLEILEAYNRIEISFLFEEVSMMASRLICHFPGSILVQYCLRYGTLEQATWIMKAIKGNITTISTDVYGSHVVQCVIDCEQRLGGSESIFKELSSNIIRTVTDRYASYVWQSLISCSWRRIMENVNEAFQGKWSEIACDERGRYLVSVILETCDEESTVCYFSNI
jgi:hypothetical protein